MVVDLRDLAGGAGVDPGAALGVFLEQAHFTEEITGVEIGEHDFVAVLVLDHYADRTVDDIVQRLRFIAGVDDRAARRIFFRMAMMQEVIQRCILSGNYFCDRVN